MRTARPRRSEAVTALSELSGVINGVNTSELALPDDYPHLLCGRRTRT